MKPGKSTNGSIITLIGIIATWTQIITFLKCEKKKEDSNKIIDEGNQDANTTRDARKDLMIKDVFDLGLLNACVLEPSSTTILVIKTWITGTNIVILYVFSSLK